MVYRLNIDPTYHPVKQKKRSFILECQKVIVEEANKLIKAGFMRKVIYLEWLVNMILVKKAKTNGKCV